ncbi:MAG TPA: tannase/feruloyl esterase family alpha/beta hydrolase [Hyphomicrobiales bacterium]|nr:tannase/feruloyl esterase family alpha/beta hydrolase [Hyphomicrobiales bacterium]
MAATLTPSGDSDIGIEVWLPLENWNCKLLSVGNGGWTGSIATGALAEGVARGYAAASTDTGHQGGSASFALGHPEKLVDFAHRATHEMTVQAKAIAARFYDNAPRHSYFNGCSAGGRQGMKAAQLYPQDYDGIVAGSPGLNWTGRALQTLWVAQGSQASPGSLIPAAKFPTLHAAALAACDGNDGVMDGVIDNPPQCTFDPMVLQCSAGDGGDCLTPAQVETARHIYAPVRNTATNAVIVPGLSPGSELGWSTMASERPFGPGVDLFRYLVFGDADWDFAAFDFAADVPATLQAAGHLDALDPDLSGFFSAGGKLLSYHGWSDPQISPGSTVQYYETVLATMGGSEAVQANHRLFMVPGMNHCGGGPGTATFDMLAALEAWVEKGEGPDSIVASHEENDSTIRTRPLCPYPQVAVFAGDGSTNVAESFSCQVP